MNRRTRPFLTATRAALPRLQAISIITTTTIHPTASAVTAAPRLRRLNLCFLLFSFLLSFFCLLTSAPPAQADCFSPGGQAGNIMYNGAYHVPQYCDGTNWRQMGQKKGVGGSSGCFLSGAPTSGLVGWWKLDDASSGNAVTTAADSSGNSHTGATQGTPKPTWTASGKIGDALILTTTGSPNQYVNVPDVASLDLTGSWTVSTWVKLTTLPTSGNGQSLLARVTTTGSDENYALYVDYGYFTSATSPSFDAHFSYSGGSNVDAFNQTAGISTGTWYLVTGTWDGTTLTLYVNGASIATSVPGHVPNGGAGATGLFIGSETTSGNYTNGTLDDVRVYNRALSAAEITALYNYTGAASISGAEGDVIYNADKHVLQFCDGTNWIPMAEGYPTSGLAAWWKLDDGSSGTTPTTAADSSGNGNTGTNMNSPTWTSSGKIGDALTFNGTNQYVSIGSYAALDLGTSDFSISAWIKSSGAGDFIAAANGCASCSFTQGFGLVIAGFTCPNSAYFQFAAGGTEETNHVCSAAPVNDGNWHLITVTVKRQSVQKLYVDGVLSGSAPTTVTGSVVFPSFGLGGPATFQSYYAGTLDDVRLYNRALSDAEVAKLAGVSTMATECNSASALVGYWKLDDGTSGSTPATAADSSGLGNNGTLTGTTLPTWTTSGRFLNALNFSNGVNTSMTFPGGNASLQLYGSWTASVWVNPAVLPGSGSYASLLERDATSYYANYALWIDNGTLVNNGMGFAVQFQDTSGVHYYAKYVPTTAIATGAWYLVTGVWDSVGQNLYLYVNGALVATQNESGHAPAAGGNAYSALGGYLNGTLDDARIYNAALSASDIALLYTTTAPVAEGDIMYNANYNVPQFCDGANWNALGRLPLSGGSSSGSNAGSLVGWWKFDDGLPTTISGLTQGGNDACAITAGKLYCWGRNANGNDGLGNTTLYDSPQQVGSDTTWSAVSQSDPNQLASACGIDAGNLYCWGANTDGELGIGNTTAYTTPQQVSGTPGGSSLVGWWKFDDGAGTTAADSSGQGNTGALVGSPLPAWTTGFINGALGFTGSSAQYVDVGSPSDFNFERTQPFSLAAWVNYDSSDGYDPLITKQGNYGNFPGYWLGVDSLNKRINVGLQGASATGNEIFVQTPGGTLTPNAWHYVVMTYNGSSTAAGVNVYIDGIAQALIVQYDALSSSILTVADMVIGSQYTSYIFGGSIDDVRVYNTALSATAVTNLYRGFTVPAVFGGDITTGLIHYWKMDAAAGSTTSADSAGSATLTKSGTGGDFAPAFINNGWSIPSGGSGELSVTTPADMLGQSALTISAWVKVGLTTSAMTFYSQSTNESLGVELDGSGNIDFDLANATYAGGNMAVPDTNWHLWTLVFDGTQTGNASRLKGYLDGVQQTLNFNGTTIPAATTTYADPFCIGPCDANPYGIIDEIRVYNRALAALDVAQLYADSFPSASPSSSWTAVSQGGTNACGIAAGALYCWGLNANGELGLGNTTQYYSSPQHVTDTPGLVGWWKFDDGSGTSAADSSGYGYTGTLVNSPAWTTGKINGALTFNGTSQSAYNSSVSLSSAPFTVSFWMKTTSTTEGFIFTQGNYIYCLMNSSPFTIKCTDAGSGGGSSTTAVNDGNWHLVTYVGTSATDYIYIDGALQATTTETANTIGSGVCIGASGTPPTCNTLPFAGTLDDVRFYNRALSATEVAALYAGTSPSPSWTAISQGTNDTCGINAGELFCWGDNYYGEDGLGNTTSPITTPTQVGTDATWTAVSQGIWDTCGIDAGKLYCWGFNHVGELGIGNSTQQTSPVQVTTGPANPASWTAVAIQNDNNGGDADACGIAAGALYCWGSNGQGELGLGTLISHNTPQLVGALTSWTSVSYSEHDACGVAGGNLYCWGDNAFGEDGLGNTTSPQKSPQPVTVVPTPTTALDSSGNNNTGTLTGSPLPVWTTGKINGALSFNGTTQWVSMGSPSSLKINHLGNQVSLSAWIYWEGHPSGLARIGGFQGYYGDYALWIASDGHILWEVDGQNGNALTTNPATVTQNAWHHIVGTFSQATGLIVYIDGAPRASAAITYYPPTEGAAYLLAVGNQEDYYFNGLIDDVRIYDRALSASEILNLYSDTSGD